jgi:SOS response regulatory protein OraA/RecX
MMLEASSFHAADPVITIRSLHAQNEGSEIAVRVLLEQGEHREERRLLITTEQYYELKLCRGVISEEMFDRLEEASLLCSAIRSGEHLLSYGANSVQMLSQKLMRRGFSRDVALSAAQKLQQMGLIDEQNDLRREMEKCLRKLWGAKRIGAHLWSRGFASDAMNELPALLEEVDFVSNCVTLIGKHYVGIPTDPDERRRMIASLSRYGYSIGEIRSAIARVEQ